MLIIIDVQIRIVHPACMGFQALFDLQTYAQPGLKSASAADALLSVLGSIGAFMRKALVGEPMLHRVQQKWVL